MEHFLKITRGAGVMLSSRVGAMGAVYFVQIFLALWLGADEFGRYSYSVFLLGLLVIPCFVGFNTAILRYVPEYLGSGDYGSARGFIMTAYGLAVVLAAIMALLLWGVMGLLVPAEWPYRETLLVGVSGLPVIAVVALNIELSRALQNIAQVYLLQDLGRPLLLLMFSFIAVHYFGDFSATATIGLFLVSAVIVGILQSVYLWRQIPRELFRHKAVFRLKHWMLQSVPFSLNTMLGVLVAQADVLVAGMILDPVDTGIYIVCSRLSALVGISLNAVNTLAGPAYAQLFTANRLQDMQHLVWRLAHIIFWPSVGVGLLMIFGGEFILRLYGEPFTAGYLCLCLLVIAQLYSTSLGSVGYLLDMTGNQWAGMRIRLVCSVTNVLLAAVLVSIYGMNGAAVAALLSMMLLKTWMHIVVKHRITIKSSIFNAFSRA